MKYRTRQGIFNTTYRGIRTQGFRQSMDADGICAYDGVGGSACAIGHCMPKAQRGRMQNTSIVFRGVLGRPDTVEAAWYGGVNIHVRRILDTARIRDVDALFAYDLQRVHDGVLSDTPAHMEERLREFAKDHGLTVPE